MGYVNPYLVTSPKNRLTNLLPICDTGAGGFSIATMDWDNLGAAVGIRWNGDSDGNHEFSKGNPVARGMPTWFILPSPIDQMVLAWAKAVAMVYPPMKPIEVEEIDWDEGDLGPGYCIRCSNKLDEDEEGESLCSYCANQAAAIAAE